MKVEKKELIFKTEDRPFPICHASNICKIDSEEVIAVWFAGTKEGAADTAIWMSRRKAEKWSEPQKLEDDMQEAHWNPVLFKKENGQILLFYKVGNNIKEWRTIRRVSDDKGKTWSEAEELVEGDRGGRGPVRCKVVELSDHSLIAGASTENGIWTAYADRSIDDGKNWKLGNPIQLNVTYCGENTAENSGIQVSEQSFYGRGVIQPSIWESEEGKVHMLLRSTEEEIYRSDSTDYGKTWSKAYSTGLPNNNSGIDVVKCRNGNLILCCNPVRKNWGERSPIVLMKSEDNGASWKTEFILEDAPGEYSYPCIIENSGMIYVSYTYDRKSIAYWELKEEKENEEDTGK